MANGHNFISLKEASRLYSIKADYLRVLINKKILKGKKVKRQWFTTKKWMEDYVQHHSRVYKENEEHISQEASEPKRIQESVLEHIETVSFEMPRAGEFPAETPSLIPVSEIASIECSARSTRRGLSRAIKYTAGLSVGVALSVASVAWGAPYIPIIRDQAVRAVDRTAASSEQVYVRLGNAIMDSADTVGSDAKGVASIIDTVAQQPLELASDIGSGLSSLRGGTALLVRSIQSDAVAHEGTGGAPVQKGTEDSNPPSYILATLANIGNVPVQLTQDVSSGVASFFESTGTLTENSFAIREEIMQAASAKVSSLLQSASQISFNASALKLEFPAAQRKIEISSRSINGLTVPNISFSPPDIKSVHVPREVATEPRAESAHAAVPEPKSVSLGLGSPLSTVKNIFAAAWEDMTSPFGAVAIHFNPVHIAGTPRTLPALEFSNVRVPDVARARIPPLSSLQLFSVRIPELANAAAQKDIFTSPHGSNFVIAPSGAPFFVNPFRGESLVHLTADLQGSVTGFFSSTRDAVNKIREAFVTHPVGSDQNAITQDKGRESTPGAVPSSSTAARSSGSPFFASSYVTRGEFESLASEVASIKRAGFVVQGEPTDKTVVERVLERIVGGVSQNDLDAKLADLNAKLLAQISRVQSSASSQVQVVTNTVALSQRVNNLGDVSISNAKLSDFSSTGIFTASTICLASNCRTTWPSDLWSVLGNNLYYTPGNIGIGTTTPYAALSVVGQGVFSYLTATSTTATSTFAGGLQANAVSITSTTATSTFANGIALSSGCFRLSDGSCAGAGVSTGGAIAGGTSGSVLFVNSTSQLAQNNANLFWSDSNNRLGLGSTTPTGQLSIGVGSDNYPFWVGHQGSSTPTFIIQGATGYVGVGTSTPSQAFSVNGGAYITATTTFGSAIVVGTLTADPSTAANGTVYYDSTTGALRAYTSNAWNPLGGGFTKSNTLVSLATVSDQVAIGTATAYGNSQLTITATSTAGIPLTLKGIVGQSANLFQVLNSSNTQLFTITGSGNVGIGTTSPAKLFSVHGNSYISGTTFFGDAITATSSAYFATQGGSVGIGTTTPAMLFSVQGNGLFSGNLTVANLTATSTALGSIWFSGASGLLATSNANLYWDNTNNRLGISSSTPLAKLSIQGESNDPELLVRVASSSLESYFDISSTGTTTISNLVTGALSFDTNAGLVTAFDMPVTSAASAGTVEGYIFQHDASNTLLVYAESDGAGGVKNQRVSVATSSAYYTFQVNGDIMPGDPNLGNQNLGNLGTSTLKWRNISVVQSNVGDLNFENGFTFTESSTTVQGLLLRNPQGLGVWYVDENGNMGLGTTTPQYKLHVLGDVAAQSFVNISTRAAKKDIQFFGDKDYDSVLEKLSQTEVAAYNYKDEECANGCTKRLGLIAEAAPSEVLSEDGKGVDIYKMTSFVFAAVKAQQRQIKNIETRIENLEAIAASGGIGVSSQASNSVFSFSSILSAFRNATVNAREFVADKITATKIVADHLELRDSATGDVYCVKITNGEWAKFKGTCGDLPGSSSSNTETSNPEPLNIKPLNVETPSEPAPEPSSPAPEPVNVETSTPETLNIETPSAEPLNVKPLNIETPSVSAPASEPESTSTLP